ncbi:MAG: plastocyanin/azurin family copper-binding protein [Halobacteriales archaeon]
MQLSRKARRQVLIGAGLLVAGGVGYWEFGRPEVVETTEVAIASPQFTPRNIRISPGDTVTWENTEQGQADIAHRIRSASDNWSFDKLIESGEVATYTFEEEGIYEAYCGIHGSADLSGESMKIGVGTDIEKPLGGVL